MISLQFPVYLSLGPWKIHPHLLFEMLSYMIGFRFYLWFRSKERLPKPLVAYIASGAIFGAALGSKMLYWLESPMTTLHHWNDISYLIAGKSIVGGLLGGLIGVELVKKWIRWPNSTGDDFVFPLMIGMVIGRIGCFLTGLDDHTYGTATTWWTGVDFGDGVLRHPTQLYEIVFLLFLLLSLLLHKKFSKFQWPGVLFQLFMVSYLSFRFVIDFIKPTPDLLWGVNNVQLACLLGLVYYFFVIRRNVLQTRGWRDA